MKINKLLIAFVAAITYIAMVVVNGLANALPINNMSTGDISNAYENLFAPAGITFSIWGLIYLLLAAYVLYQFGLFQKDHGKSRRALFNKVNLWFILSSVANISWIFAWHYDYIGLSVLIMAVLLISLIKITDIINKEKLSTKEKYFVRLPFSVYFGWITVATIANITVFLVSINWNGFGISEQIWTVVILLAGLLIGALRMMKDKILAYGFVLVWAYVGILIKHLSADGFARQYEEVIITVIISIITFVIGLVYIFKSNNKPLPFKD